MTKIVEEDSENPFWTKSDFARAVPVGGLPVSLQSKLRAIQESNAPTGEHKVPVRLRLSPDVVKALEAGGGDMSAKVDDILKERLVA